MKFTQKQLIDFVLAAGVPTVEVVDDEKAADYSLDDALASVDAARTDIIRPAIEQELSGRLAGKFGGNLERYLVRNTGIPAKDIEALKTDEEKVKAAAEFMKSTLAVGKEDVQKKLDELLENANKEKEAAIAAKDKEVTEWKGKYNDRNYTTALMDSMKNWPLPANVDKRVAAEDFKSYLQSKYDLTYDEAGKALKMMTRPADGGTPMEALNSKGNDKLKLDEAAKEYYTPRGMWSKDMRSQRPEDALNDDGTKKNEYERREPAQVLGSSKQVQGLNADVNSYLDAQLNG